jgi:[calcium/calmodulin-dependent protein kinase] kinase
MFEKQSDMTTAKSAGSPAFMPPELCVAKHGNVSGKAADIWSMGVTLYCLRYGKIPFEKTHLLDMYEAIRSDEFPLPEEQNSTFEDLIRRVLEKDPERRIKMDELRVHPWVTKNGEDPLLSKEENCADMVDTPTEEEMNRAITGNMKHLLVVVRMDVHTTCYHD